MTDSNTQTVKVIKEALSKELGTDTSDDERCLDLLSQLEKCDITLQMLKDTLIGAVVSKMKSNANADVSKKARGLIKCWKALAKQNGVVSNKSNNGTASKSTSASSSSNAAASGGKSGKKKSSKMKRSSSTASSSSNTTSQEPAVPQVDTTEWDHLPPNRQTMAQKFHTVFYTLSHESLSKEINTDALSSLHISRSTEVEAAIHTFAKGNKSAYATKLRSLLFNLKNNTTLREAIILGTTSSSDLCQMTPAQLAPAEIAKERSETISKMNDSRQLDWEQANEAKINEMCGIKGDLLKASLFTCGRCKSEKTTSTQKQTRSADEPMTVFVLCLNCGKRWKC